MPLSSAQLVSHASLSAVQVIILPWLIYTVQGTDTLASIASRFQTTTGQLKSLNPALASKTPQSLQACFNEGRYEVATA